MNQSRIITLLVSCLMALAVMAQNVTHTVERGETLESIAERYGVTTGQITELNPDAEQFIYVGMQLTIPVADKVSNAASPVTPSYEARPVQRASQPAAVMADATDYSRTSGSYNDDSVVGDFFVTAQYKTIDFDDFKLYGMYGLGIKFTSIGRWDWFHIGANVDFNINAGLVDDSGCFIYFGPTLRADIIRNIFVLMPVDAVCGVRFKGTDTKTSWGMHLSPSIYGFFTDRFGIFVGPNVTFSFDGGDPSFGMQCGLAIKF